MSILTCTNVHPSNEVVTMDNAFYTGDELAEFRKQHPEYDDLPDDDPVFYKNPPKFSFQFNCSGGTGCLRFFTTKYTNVKTGESFSSHAPKFSMYTSGSEYNNGDTITFGDGLFTSKVTNGQNWQYQRTIYQADKSQLGKDKSEPLYDMKFNQGKVAVEGRTIKISTGINNLLNAAYMYNPKKSDGTIDYTKSCFGYYGDKKELPYSNTTVTIDGGSNCYLIGGAVIEINNTRRLIKGYDKKTGVLTLDGSFSGVKTGDKFVIYTSYFIDKPHYVMVRSVPNMGWSVHNIHSNRKDYGRNTYNVKYISNNVPNNYWYKTVITYTGDKISDSLYDTISNRRKSDFDTTGLHCACSYKQSSYNQADYSPLKYYQYSVYEGVTDSEGKINKGRLITQSKDIYDDDVCYDFYIPVINVPYVVQGRVVTQENAVYENDYANEFFANTDDNGNYLKLPIEKDSFSSRLSTDKTRIILNWKWSEDVQGRYAVYRRHKLGSNEWSDWNIIQCTSMFSKSAGDTATVYDYTAGNNVEYQYLIQYMYISDDSRVDNDTNKTITITNTVKYYEPYLTPSVQHQWDETIITSIVPKESGVYWKENAYSPIETWKFVCPPDANDILQNLGINLYDSTNGMPLLTRTNKEYESSSFSVDLLQLNCPDGTITDDIALVKKWVKFINGNNDFMLKSLKGDVWIIEISGNPSRSYDYGGDISLTTVKYDWVQVVDTEKVYIS